jgi:hypothetical protein
VLDRWGARAHVRRRDGDASEARPSPHGTGERTSTSCEINRKAVGVLDGGVLVSALLFTARVRSRLRPHARDRRQGNRLPLPTAASRVAGPDHP